LCAEGGEGAEGGDKSERNQDQAGADPEPAGEGDAGGEEAGGVKEGYSAQAGGGGRVGGWPGEVGVNLHRDNRKAMELFFYRYRVVTLKLSGYSGHSRRNRS
jgi:hypothetical protein